MQIDSIYLNLTSFEYLSYIDTLVSFCWDGKRASERFDEFANLASVLACNVFKNSKSNLLASAILLKSDNTDLKKVGLLHVFNKFVYFF